MIGPLKSADPYVTYMVRGEIHVPILEPRERERTPRVFDPRFNIQTWKFNIPVQGSFLQTTSGRQWIEDEVRYKFYPELAALWPIRMTVERFDY